MRFGRIISFSFNYAFQTSIMAVGTKNARILGQAAIGALKLLFEYSDGHRSAANRTSNGVKRTRLDIFKI